MPAMVITLLEAFDFPFLCMVLYTVMIKYRRLIQLLYYIISVLHFRNILGTGTGEHFIRWRNIFVVLLLVSTEHGVNTRRYFATAVTTKTILGVGK